MKDSRPPDSAPRTRWLALGALAVAMLTIGLDITVLVVALPTMAVDLHADTAALQWFSTSYTLALAALMLPAGALGDRYGRKKFLVAALALFGIASAACALATGVGPLIAARALLGVAAAAMMPLSMGVLPSLFPDPTEQQRALTVWITSSAIGLPLGPIVGGYLLQHFWWGSVFLINVPMVAIGLIAVVVLVPESRSENAFRIDLPGVALVVAGMTALTYGSIDLGQNGWGNAVAWTVAAAGAVLLALFVLWQRRTPVPLVDLDLFAGNGFRLGTLFSILVNFAMFGLFFTVPQYFQAVLGTDALGSGLRLLPLIGGLIVGTRLTDRLMAALGRRTVLVIGFPVLALALALGALTTVTSGYGYVAVWITLLGVGMGLVMPAAMGMAMADLTAERAGTGSALLQALRQAGGTIGTAVLGTVLATRYRSGLGSADHTPISDSVNAGVAVAHRLDDADLLHTVQSAFVGGMSAMVWACAGACAIAAVIAAVFTASDPVPESGQDTPAGTVRTAAATGPESEATAGAAESQHAG